MTKMLCPNCGSENVQIQQVSETRQLTLGPNFTYAVPIHICTNCGEEGDFDGNGDTVRESAISTARKELAELLIQDIQQNTDLKLAYVERALELPQRTISSKWRTGISASGLALLRIVSAMPWVVHVADNKFTSAAIGHEIANLLVDKGATIETVAGGADGIHIKITRASVSPNAHLSFGTDQMLATGT